MIKLPLVTCIMPTRNRHALAALAVENFRAQSWPKLELVIVDDSERVFMPRNSDGIRVLWTQDQQSVGDKMNAACEKAKGEIIVKWDDDDWSGPDRIRDQVAALMLRRADMCSFGYDEILKLPDRKFYCGIRPALSILNDAPLAFTKDVWRRFGPFPPGVDQTRVMMLKAYQGGAKIEEVPAHGRFTYIRHGDNWWSMSPQLLREMTRPSGMPGYAVDLYAAAVAGGVPVGA